MMSLSRAQKLLMEASVLHAGSQGLATRVQAECLTSKPCSKAAALGGCCPRILRLLCPWRLLPLEFAALETACPWRLLPPKAAALGGCWATMTSTLLGWRAGCSQACTRQHQMLRNHCMSAPAWLTTACIWSDAPLPGHSIKEIRCTESTAGAQ